MKIGDCYVVLGIIELEDREIDEEALNVIKMAFQMLEIINAVKQRLSYDYQIEDFKELNMRIGIHTGDIIGGILGTDIVRYDIYGKNVLIANKMESNGMVGSI